MWRPSCLLGFLALAACAPVQKETTAAGATDPAGFLTFAARASSAPEHWSADVALRDAPAGTYALVVDDGPPVEPVVVSDFAVQCARAGGKACALARGGAVVALADIGPGGAGILRAAFGGSRFVAERAGAWFTLVRVDGAAGTAQVAVRVLSEALRADEKPARFEIVMSPALNAGGGST